MNKWPEYATTLINYGNKVVQGLHALKQQLNDKKTSSLIEKPPTYNQKPIQVVSPARMVPSKPIIFVDPYYRPLIGHIMRKFPDVGDLTKVEGYDYFKMNAKPVMDSLYPASDMICSALDLVEASENLLFQFANMKNILPDHHDELFLFLFKIFVNYVTCITLISSLPAYIKPVVVLYGRAYFIVHSRHEAHSAKMSNLIRINTPFRYIGEALGYIDKKIVGWISQFKYMIHDRVAANLDLLKKKGILQSVLHEATFPTPNGTHQEDPSLNMLIMNACFLSCLCFPQVILDNPSALDLVARSMQFSTVVPLFRDETIDFMPEFDKIASEPRYASLKISLGSSAYLPSETYAKFHGDRRHFLLNELDLLTSHVDSNALILKNLRLVINMTYMAKQELQWLCQVENDRLVQKKEASTTSRNHDDLIPFIHTLNRVYDRLREGKEAIISYCTSFIEEFVFPELLKTLEACKNSPTWILLESFYQLIASCEKPLSPSYIKAVCSEWLFSQTTIASLNTNSNKILYYEKICFSAKDLLYYSRFLYEFDEFIKEVASPSFCYFYQPVLHDHLKTLLESQEVSVQRLSCLGSLVKISSTFPEEYAEFWPSEHEHIGTDSVLYVQEILSILGQIASLMAHDLGLFKISMLKQITNMTGGTDKGDFIRGRIEMMKKLRIKLRYLLNVLSDTAFKIHDSEFNLAQYFLDALSSRIKSFVQSTVILSPNPTDKGMSFDVKRPSVVLEELHAYFNALLEFDNDLNGSIVHQISVVLKEQTSPEIAARLLHDESTNNIQGVSQNQDPKFNKRISLYKEDRIQIINSQTLLVSYVVWYSELITTKTYKQLNASLGSFSMLYSPKSQLFYSNTNGLNYQTISNIAASTTIAPSLQADMFTNPEELEALCNLLGLEGIKYFNHRLLQIVSENILQLKEIAYPHIPNLRYVANDPHSPNHFEFIKEFCSTSNMDTFYSKVVLLTSVYKFREHLNQALTRIMKSQSPLFIDCVQISQEKSIAEDGDYFGRDRMAQWKKLDALASQLGQINVYDFDFVRTLNIQYPSLANDAALWQQLPTLFSLSLCHLAVHYENYKYDSATGAITNNLHLIGHCFHILSQYLTGLSTANKKQIEQKIQATREKFIHDASCLLHSLKTIRDKEWSDMNLNLPFRILLTYYNNVDMVWDINARHFGHAACFELSHEISQRKSIDGKHHHHRVDKDVQEMEDSQQQRKSLLLY